MEGKIINNYAEIVFGKDNRMYLMGVAIVWIVLFHLSYWTGVAGGQSPWWIRLFSEGQLGVDIFLFLSSYGLEASFEKNKLFVFWHNRIRRLFPVYFFFLIVLFLLFENHCPCKRIIVQCLYQITGLSLFQYPEFFSSGFCFDWFTPAIIIIYVIFPILSWIIRYFATKYIFYEILLLFLAIFVGNWIHVNKHLPIGLLSYRMAIVLLGSMTFVHLRKGRLQRLLSLFFISSCFAFLCGERALILSLTIPHLLFVFSLVHYHLPLKRLISFIGKYSYEVYLSHIYAVAFFIPKGIVTDPYWITLITISSTIIIAFCFSLGQKSYILITNNVWRHGS